jgi:hypothetical protein
MEAGCRVDLTIMLSYVMVYAAMLLEIGMDVLGWRP